MTTSSRVKALLELTETDQNTFAAAFGMTTPQAMSNKLRRDSWSARDLAKAAALCGAKLAFILPDGSQLIPAPGGLSSSARGVLLVYGCNKILACRNIQRNTNFVVTKK